MKPKVSVETAMKPWKAWGAAIKSGELISIGAAILIGLAVWNAIAPAGLPRITAPIGISFKGMHPPAIY